MSPEQLLEEFRTSLSYPLDPFQVEAIRALLDRHSVLVAAPTGTGKTVVGEFGIFMARKYNARAFYTTPIKALSNQKFRDFQKRFGEAEVGLLTGDVVVNPTAPILVMTTEVLRNMLVQSAPLGDLGCVVFDEVHYMGDPERGTAWEESILLAPREIPLICLSATVPNVNEISEWIREAHGELTTVIHDERAIPLEHRYWVPDLPPKTTYKVPTVLDADGKKKAPASLMKVGGEIAAKVHFSNAASRLPKIDEEQAAEQPNREPPAPWKVIRHLEEEGLTPAIYFVFSRRATEESAASCMALKPVPHAAELVREAKARLADLSPEDRALRQVALLFRLLPRGVAVHHAGMLPQLKMLVEELFQSGRLRAVFATDTLALGVNMPARTVVVAEMLKYDGVARRLLKTNEYRQMTGRAGRRGLDERGVSVVLYSGWVPFKSTFEVMTGPLLPLESAFRPTYSTAMNLWLTPEDEERLADLYARSLRRFQNDRDLQELTEEKQQLEDELEKAKASGAAKRKGGWEKAGELSRVDHELRSARRAASLEARSTVVGLAAVLERYDYLRSGRPTFKAPYLRALFDTNSITLCELLLNRQLEGLQPEELAEALSWFSTDRDSPMRGLRLTTRLHRVREALDHLHGGVLREEERHGVQISRPLPPDFHGVALAWAQGDELADIARRAHLQEGDLVGALQKTLDLVGQIKQAALRGEIGAPLIPVLDEADKLLRRGVVEASYEWAIKGLPEDDEEGEEAEDWEVPIFHQDEEGSGFRRRNDFGRRRREGDRRPPARRGQAARKDKKEKVQAKLVKPNTPPKPSRRVRRKK